MTIEKTEPESVYHEKLETLISPYFYLKHDEVYGKHWTGNWVRPDFIIYPKPKLIKAGVPEKYYGVEVKTGGLKSGCKKQSIELVAQAISYAETAFRIKGKSVYLEAVFMYPSMKYYADLAFGRDLSEHRSEGVAYALERIAGRFSVGDITVNPKHKDIRFSIADTPYLTIYPKKTMWAEAGTVYKGKVPLGGKIQIGSKLLKRT
jgi:hypothetical protein